MKHFFREKSFCGIFCILASLMYFILFGCSLWLTGVQGPEIEDEFIYIQRDSIGLNVLYIIIALVVLFFLGKLADRLHSMKVRNILLSIVCVCAGIFGVYWVIAGNALPMADQFYLCQFAEAFNAGDFTGMEWGGYVARYPQQLGIISLLRVYHFIFRDVYVRAFQITVALCVPLMILAGCMILRHLTEKNVKVEIYYLFFMVFCVPMYAYSSFVYGDLISTIFGMLGVWIYLACLKKFSYGRLVLFAVFMGVAVQLRQNLLILVIAVGIVAVVRVIFKFSWHNFLLLAALIVGVLGLRMGVDAVYANVTEDNAPGIPAVLYVVMGLNDDEGRPGWHNNYEYDTFEENGDDVQVATEVAMVHLKMYRDIYKNDPSYMLDFFTRKMNSQWHAPMYQSLVMTAYNGGNQISPIKEIYEYEKITDVITFWMKVYQMLMYGSILFLLLRCRRKWENLEKYTLLICVFGGFLFSLMWEAKTRYVLPYLFMQIPYMAMGLNEVVCVIEEKLGWIKKHCTRS